MDISAYMEKNGLSQSEFARLVGVTQSMVSQWLTRRRPISAKRARTIEQKTGGKLSRKDLRPDIFG